MVEKIEHEGRVLALIIRRDTETKGVNFFTGPENPLQLGILRYSAGFEVKPHIHRKSTRTIEDIQEVLHIEYGKVEAEFYESAGKKIGSTVLNSGDTILLLSGGHGFNILEDSKIMEVKQGPYYGVDEDKVRI